MRQSSCVVLLKLETCFDKYHKRLTCGRFCFCFCGTPILSDLRNDTANRSCPINMPVARRLCGEPRRTPRRPHTSQHPQALTRPKSHLPYSRVLLALDLMHSLRKSLVNGESAFHTNRPTTHHHIHMHTLVHTHTYAYTRIHAHKHTHFAHQTVHATHPLHSSQTFSAACTPVCTPSSTLYSTSCRLLASIHDAHKHHGIPNSAPR